VEFSQAMSGAEVDRIHRERVAQILVLPKQMSENRRGSRDAARHPRLMARAVRDERKRLDVEAPSATHTLNGQ
jgi:hypothetical protein